MKALRSILCDKPPYSAANDSLDPTRAVQSRLLQLPLELRRMIYFRHFQVSRSPSPEDVYQRNLRAIWEDLPSPLLRVNKQIRNEVFDIMQRGAFTLRVTSHGASFDMFGLSCFIAQQRPKSYGGLRKFIIEIWPPHPDRPIEMYNIYYHVRELRDKLRATTGGIPKLVIDFMENEIAKWTRDGQPRFDLECEPRFQDILGSDVARVLDHFTCVTNVSKAGIILPPSSKDYDELADCVCETMEGDGTLAHCIKDILRDFGISEFKERQLKRLTAEKARAKLDALTRNGDYKMADDEWFTFTELWPHFEFLSEWSEGGAFKGEGHYRSYQPTSSDPPRCLY